jgi:hypothetical protein
MNVLLGGLPKSRESSKRKHKDELDKQIHEVVVLEKKHRKAMMDRGGVAAEEEISSPGMFS